MPLPRPFELIRTAAQWRLVAHDNTALHGDVVQLARVNEEIASGESVRPGIAAGLAFDSNCRLYLSVPDEGRVERALWAAGDPLKPRKLQPTTLDLFHSEEPELGDFQQPETSSALSRPTGLAVDQDDRLFIAETGAKRILIFDLWSRRLLRTVALQGEPVDLTASGRRVYALLRSPNGLVRLDARSSVEAVELPESISDPTRIACSPRGGLFVLDRGRTAGAVIVALDPERRIVEAPHATDIEFQTPDSEEGAFENAGRQSEQAVLVVVARLPGADFLRFHIGADTVTEATPLKARGYDGRGIVRTPDNRIGFRTSRGFRHAVSARPRYVPKGGVTSFQLDSGVFQTVWGRLFLDACIPEDSSLRVHCVSSDEPSAADLLERTQPANAVSLETPERDEFPRMPPLSFVPADDDVAQRLHRRETDYEIPWVRRAGGDAFQTYEAPVMAGPGRYLWVTVEMTGNTRVTPRLRGLRAEYPSHDLLRRLPKLFSRDAPAEEFLRRYLAMFDGTFGELEGVADQRHALIDPRGAPTEALPWLAGFVGLVLDGRWPVDARRTAIAEAVWLFRFRGTVAGLTRFLEIYTNVKVTLIEKYRLRGMGEALLGDPESRTASSVLGAGFRVGGSVGESDETELLETSADAFATHVHRFAVIIPATLSAEQRDVVRHILEVHRPAHTLYEICTVDAGMRIGRGLHVELPSIIGRQGGFKPLHVGYDLLGRDGIIGRPEPGTSVGGSRLGRDSRVG